jgi:hypothetical protein
MLAVTLLLCAVAAFATAKATRAFMHRFGLDATTTLLWLGLAEWPKEPSPVRKQNEKRTQTKATVRSRRPTHRARSSRTAERRPAVPRPAR